jgi:hypothetical protein
VGQGGGGGGVTHLYVKIVNMRKKTHDERGKGGEEILAFLRM